MSREAKERNATPEGEEFYLALREEFLRNPGVTESTMMGFPCLRFEGAFFAPLDPSAANLILKLPAERVTSLIDAGGGSSFAPNGRRFREWVAIGDADRATCVEFLQEALEFAASD